MTVFYQTKQKSETKFTVPLLLKNVYYIMQLPIVKRLQCYIILTAAASCTSQELVAGNTLYSSGATESPSRL